MFEEPLVALTGMEVEVLHELLGSLIWRALEVVLDLPPEEKMLRRDAVFRQAVVLLATFPALGRTRGPSL
jgi:hypothetical protein